MYRKIIALALLFLSGSAMTHEWTPTYPEMRHSFVDGVMVTTMRLFNKRKDIYWYEITVYDKDFNTIPYMVSDGKVQRISPLRHKNIDVFIREKDVSRATYICSRSKVLSGSQENTFVSSRICSKIK